MSTFLSSKAAYLGFNYFTKIGPVKIKRLLAYFPDIATAFQAEFGDLKRAGVKEALAEEFVYWRRSFQAEMIQENLAKNKINFLSWEDLLYPKILLNISSPPPSFYYRGHLKERDSSNDYKLAVVGSRRFSAYSEKIINTLFPALIKAGIKIISGLALGVDTIAHQTTLTNQGITWAILGSGLTPKNIYPAENFSLAERIVAQGGALISEFPPDFPPLKQNFPQRNRLIAGLCAATLIVEAPQKSGALITANFALEEGREVLAVPGNIFSELSIGANNLLKEGAYLVNQASDILNIYGLETKSDPHAETPPIKSPLLNNSAEKLIYNIIKEANEKSERPGVDEIIKKSQLDTALINSKLSILELRGIIRQNSSYYELI